jgi:hypothetical protein
VRWETRRLQKCQELAAKYNKLKWQCDWCQFRVKRWRKKLNLKKSLKQSRAQKPFVLRAEPKLLYEIDATYPRSKSVNKFAFV